MAVPMTVKMPEPMTAPMPRAVRDQGPRDFFSAFPGSSDSRISLSMDLQASSWLGSAVLLLSCSVPAQDLPGDKLSHRVHFLKDEKAYAAVYMMTIGPNGGELRAEKMRKGGKQIDG